MAEPELPDISGKDSSEDQDVPSKCQDNVEDNVIDEKGQEKGNENNETKGNVIDDGFTNEVEEETDDEDFVPKTKSRKAPPPRVTRKKMESSDESSEDEEESGNDSEEDEPSPKKRKKVTKSSSKQEGVAGSRQPIKKKSFQPKMAPRPKPLGKAVDSLAEAQQRLHVSAVPESLPCREDEFAEVGIVYHLFFRDP